MSEVERRLMRATVKALLDNGFAIIVNDGEEETEVSTSPRKIFKDMATTDEDFLIAVKDGKRFGWVRLIYGNGSDLISDYTTNLEDVLKPANDLAIKLDR